MRVPISIVATMFAGVVAASLAEAQTPSRVPPADATQVRLSLAPVVKKALPAVVNVYASRVENRPRSPFFDDPVFRQFFGDPGDNSRTSQSLGSGVMVDPAGLIVTNEHVIDGMTKVKVALTDRREFDAQIVLADKRTDLAILKISGDKDFPVLPLGDSDSVEVGDFVVAIGNPFGVGQTVTQGIISALPRSQAGIGDYSFFLQTDAAINPGNSGGALVDMGGKLVGINSAIYSRSGGSMGIGFAIPVDMVKAVVAAAENGGKAVRRPWLGASLQDLTLDLAESLGLKRPAGALVVTVDDGSPAAAAGLKNGDLIQSIDGQPVDDSAAVGFRLATKALGGRSEFGVLRGGKALTLSIALAAPPETPSRDAIRIEGRSPFQGAEAMNLSPAVIEELSLAHARAGVVIADVAEGSIAANVGLRKGDVVLEVNGKKITATRDLERVAAERARFWDLTISRDGQTIRTEIGG